MASQKCCGGSSELARSAGLKGFPQTEDEIRIAQEALASDLAKLSLDEHERVLFDIHGIAQVDDEDPAPEKIEQALRDLENELELLEAKPSYEKVKAINPDYVNDRDFRLMFLRCHKFNAKDAAALMEEHFHTKSLLFGSQQGYSEEILGRDIRYSDLSQEDIDNLRLGKTQLFPSRDAAGRAVFTANKRVEPSDNAESVGRGSWLLHMSALKDVETQKKGLVFVAYFMGAEEPEMGCGSQSNSNIRSAIPDRIVGAHFCYNHKNVEKFAAGIPLFLHEEGRHRFRTHFGNLDHIHFELQTYGLPAQDSPMQEDGTWSTEWHLEWLEMLKYQEQQELQQLQAQQEDQIDTISSSATPADNASPATNHTISQVPIVVPKRFDVLFGKSKKERESTGNLRALHLVDLNQEKYESANKFEKTEVAERIVNIVHESGGRFLRKEAAGWLEVDHEAAREKISHFFRQNRVKTKRQNGNAESNKDKTATDEAAKRSLGVKQEPTKRMHMEPTSPVFTVSMDGGHSSSEHKRVTPNSSPTASPLTVPEE